MERYIINECLNYVIGVNRVSKGRKIYESKNFIIKLLETKPDGTRVYLQKYKNADWHETYFLNPRTGISGRHETDEKRKRHRWFNPP